MDIEGKIIAIDGPAGSGKSSVAKALAKKLSYTYIDTGAMYRSVAWKALESEVALEDQEKVEEIAATIDLTFSVEADMQSIIVDGDDVTTLIRTEEVGRGASTVSIYGGVRSAMTELQRKMGSAGRVVMEGRDVGTVVFPNAHIKFFMSASVEERGRRRYKELQGRGVCLNFETVLSDLKERDDRDQSRELAPLKAAPDAVVVDTTNLSFDEVVRNMLELMV